MGQAVALTKSLLTLSILSREGVGNRIQFCKFVLTRRVRLVLNRSATGHVGGIERQHDPLLCLFSIFERDRLIVLVR